MGKHFAYKYKAKLIADPKEEQHGAIKHNRAKRIGSIDVPAF